MITSISALNKITQWLVTTVTHEVMQQMLQVRIISRQGEGELPLELRVNKQSDDATPQQCEDNLSLQLAHC